jgi:hypothetical protein
LCSNEEFESYAQKNYKDQFKNCPEFIRHKTTLIHPDNLLKQGIKMRRAVQRPREYIISRAAAYHSGFNAGFNIAEAVNFALPAWIPMAEKAKPCICRRDSVRIDIKEFISTISHLPQYKYLAAADGPRSRSKSSSPPHKETSKSAAQRELLFEIERPDPRAD